VTNVYLTSTAADAAVTVGSGTKWAAGFAPGASATHLNKNTVAGPTAPLQMTDGAAGADGTVVSFYTPPLRAVTIAGAITCLMWDRENATSNNVAPTIRIERCSGDGTVQSTIVSETTNHGALEMGGTSGGISDTISVTAGNVTDTALSDGDRLRITLWIDDSSGQGGSGSMASGGRGEFWVNGPNGAQGQAQLAFTEIVQPLDGPHIVQIVEVSWTGTSTPLAAVLSAAEDGDAVLVVMGGDGGLGGNTVTASTVTTTAGTTGSWSDIEKHINTANTGWLHAAQAEVTATGSVTVSLARTQTGTARAWGGFAVLIRDTAGLGDQSFGDTGSAEVVSLTVAALSAVFSISIDWDTGTPATGWAPTGGTDIERAAEGGNYTVHAGYWVGQGAGTRDYGTNNTSSATNLRQVAVEFLAPASGTPATVTPGVVAAVAALPAATPSAGVAKTPAVTAAAVSLPAATPSAGATKTPTVTTATAALPAAAPSVADVAAPAVAAATVSLPPATISASATVTPAPVAATLTAPPSAASIGAAAAPVTAVGALPAATPATAGNATPTPAALSAPVSVPQTVPSAAATVAPNATAATAVLLSATPHGAAGAAPAVVAVAAALPRPGVLVGAGPALVAAATAFPQATPTSAGNATVAPAVVAAAAAIAQAGASISASPALFAVLVGVPQATGSVSDTAAPGVAAAGVGVGQASTATAGNALVTPAPVALIFSFTTPAAGNLTVIIGNLTGPVPDQPGTIAGSTILLIGAGAGSSPDQPGGIVDADADIAGTIG
jgi:hypothetical protein